MIFSILSAIQVTPTIQATSPSTPVYSSFGNRHVPEIASVNWTRFWQVFNAHSTWNLEYNEGSSWISVKGDMQVIKDYVMPFQCKITLDFTASHSADYRLTFAIDLRVKKYVYKEAEYRYILTYQDYTVTFDWSDVAKISNVIITHGIKNLEGTDYFWWRVRRDNVPVGAHIVIDPLFGYETEGDTPKTIEDYIRGSWFTCPESMVQAKSITVYVYHATPAHMKCAVYKESDNSCVAETEERTITAGLTTWERFYFAVPPILENIKYILVAWADGEYYIYGTFEAQKGRYDTETYNGFPETLDPTVESYKYSIYCTYANVELDVTSVPSSVSFALNSTLAPYENFNTYTDVEPDDRIQKTSTHIDAYLIQSENSYVYKDFGLNYFGDFEHSIDIRQVDDSPTNWFTGFSWGMANVIEPIKNGEDTKTKIAVGFYQSGSSGLWKVTLNELYNGTWYVDAGSNCPINTWRYLRIEKHGTLFTCKIYSDLTRTNLIETLKLSLHTDHEFRYLYAVSTRNNNDAGNYANVDIENLGDRETTPYSEILANGTYQISFPSSFDREGLTWNFAYWDDNTSNTNPDRTIDLQEDTSLSVTYNSECAPIPYAGYDLVFECAMNNMFELNGILEGNDTYRQMLLDTSPYENHGKIYPLTHPYAGPTLTWGRMGKALEFDGVDDSVIVANSDSLNITDAITIEFWFTVYNISRNQVIMSKFSGALGQWTIGVGEGGAGKLYTELWTTSGTKYAEYQGNEYTGNIEAGIFYFVSLTYDYRDGYYTVYLHGTPQYNVTTDGNKIRNVDKNLYLGNLGNSSFWFNGVLDEVRIFPYKRNYDQIYTDARTPISRFDSWSFGNSGTSSDGETWNVVEGTTSGYQGFKNNDPVLPWAYSNDIHLYTFVRTIRYMAGFQQYQLYCNVKFSYNDTYSQEIVGESYITWYWSFFKDGRLQVTYDVKVRPAHLSGAPVYRVYKWNFTVRRTTPYLGTEELYSTIVNVNATLFQNYVPIIVSAWVGPDNKKFTLRIDSQDARLVTSVYSGMGFPLAWGFDLVDENLNPHVVDWFDGWVVAGIKARCHRNNPGNWAKMEIESHKLAWFIPIIIAAAFVIGGIAAYYLSPQVKEVVHTVIEEVVTILQPIAEIVGTAVKKIGEGIVDALSGLAHDFIGAISGLSVYLGQALKPISDLLMGLGGVIVQAFISFIGPLLSAIVNAAQLMGETFVKFVDSVYGWLGFPGLFSGFLNFLVNGWNWMMQSLAWLASALTPIFSFLQATMGKFLNTLATVVGQWVSIIQGVFAMLDNGYGYTTGIWDQIGLSTWVILIAILYPIYLLVLWEEEGIDAVINQLKFLMDVMAWVIRILITAIQVFIRVIQAIIESIPVVE